ncbi:MAG: S9 family peptidase [Candidatus Rokubacteria bacterium]|nr:S9 family peptidase [Candidatus Rokubacteria bacterium]MBI3826338.1 S9 family peptidase [Candidatus Rokubacteria bacterium]
MPSPPVAKTVPRVQVLHGDRLEDPYHWLREKGSPDVVAYLTAENAYTDAVMKGTEAIQESLYAEMLGRIKEDDQTVPFRRGEWLYYSRTEKGRQYPIYCRQRAESAPEQVTLDVNGLAEGHPFCSIGPSAVSDDGDLLAYTVDFSGFREFTLHVKDLRTGALLGERIGKVASVAWSARPDTLFYVTEDHAKRAYRLWRHRLGASADDLLYEETDELFRLHVSRTRSRAFVLASSRSFTSAETRYLPASDPGGPWRVIQPREADHEYDVDHGVGPGGGLFYIRTNGDGFRNFRLVTAPVDQPSRARWTELIAHREDVMLEDVDVFACHYVVHERAEGLIRLRVTELASGEAHHVEFPEPAYDVSSEFNPEADVRAYRFRYQSMITPPSVFDYDLVERRLTLLKRTEVLGGYDPSRYRVERRQATAGDGTAVPISLVAPAGAALDGTSPLLLAGYGAYGLPYPVTFSSSRLSLLERGLVVAIAHVRGGGEKGKRWHDAGRMLNKRNTFTDFIAAADHLVAAGHTSRDRLVIEGGSAGGLLIGAVLNRRPDLAAAAVLRVPFVDVINTMLDEELPLTVGEFEEWGNPKIREHYEAMKSYCPYTNIADRRYPAILVKTSINDSQVMYWEPAKYVARMRARRTDDTPLLLKVNMEAGHGGASGRYDALKELALDYAWILGRLGRAGEARPQDATRRPERRSKIS